MKNIVRITSNSFIKDNIKFFNKASFEASLNLFMKSQYKISTTNLINHHYHIQKLKKGTLINIFLKHTFKENPLVFECDDESTNVGLKDLNRLIKPKFKQIYAKKQNTKKNLTNLEKILTPNAEKNMAFLFLGQKINDFFTPFLGQQIIDFFTTSFIFLKPLIYKLVNGNINISPFFLYSDTGLKDINNWNYLQAIILQNISQRLSMGKPNKIINPTHSTLKLRNIASLGVLFSFSSIFCSQAYININVLSFINKKTYKLNLFLEPLVIHPLYKRDDQALVDFFQHLFRI